MSQWDFAVNFFVALFALIDPIGMVPFFASATTGQSGRDRAKIAALISVFAVGFLAFFYFTGVSLLAFFGISMPAFRIAGGIILFIAGLEMVRGHQSDSDEEAGIRPRAKETTAARFERMLVPFTMPLLIGPGAISTVIIYASQGRMLGLAGAAIGVGVIAAVAVSVFIAFQLTPVISRILGKIGLAIVVRVLGLILCAMAVQFILSGLSDATRGFIRHDAAVPYEKN